MLQHSTVLHHMHEVRKVHLQDEGSALFWLSAQPFHQPESEDATHSCFAYVINTQTHAYVINTCCEAVHLLCNTATVCLLQFVGQLHFVVH